MHGQLLLLFLFAQEREVVSMKVVFLDIDGVLNSEKWHRYLHDNVDPHEWSAQYPFYEIDPESVKWLNYVTDQTGAKIVVSSAWRLGRTIEELTGILQKCGVTGEIIDITPHMQFTRATPDTVPRGCEIDYWLSTKGFVRINWSKDTQKEYEEKAQVKNYVIFDDDSDIMYDQREHFVKCPAFTGLTEIEAKKAIEILNKSIMTLYYE